MTSPDGSVWYEDEGIVALEGEASPNDSHLAVSGIRACFEPEDQLGTYTVNVEVHDSVGGSMSILQDTVELIELELGASFADRDEYLDWQYDAALYESPERAIKRLARVRQ